MENPVPVQPEYLVEIFVTPSPPADTRLSPPLPPREQSANLHLHIVAYFAEGATGVAYPEVVDPAGKHGVDLRNQHLGRGCTPMPDEFKFLASLYFALVFLKSGQSLQSSTTITTLYFVRHLLGGLIFALLLFIVIPRGQRHIGVGSRFIHCSHCCSDSSLRAKARCSYDSPLLFRRIPDWNGNPSSHHSLARS